MLMKILHTADWHIGKKYNNTDFLPDFTYFSQQLLRIIQEQKINILLVTGDVFDVYSPPVSAQKAYYQLLASLDQIESLKHIIITAGNHDSISFLEAPASILSSLNVQIVGQALSLDEVWSQINIGDEKVNIAVVPFLRNSDFPSLNENASYEDFRTRNAEGLIAYYKQLSDHIPQNNAPNIATGHFTCLHDYDIDSEREITIGNIDGTGKNQLPVFDYFALGHIHKPINISLSNNIYYSGSPYPMSFSEKDDTKRVNIIEVKNGQVQLQFETLQCFRKFIQLKGDSCFELESQLIHLNKTLYSAIQIELKLKTKQGTVAAYKELMELQNRYNDMYIEHSENINIEKITVVQHKLNEKISNIEKPNFNTEFKSPEELLGNILSSHSEKFAGHEAAIKKAFQEIINS